MNSKLQKIFYEKAKDFCEFLETKSISYADTDDLSIRLAELMIAVLRLSDVEPSEAEIVYSSYDPKHLNLEIESVYWLIFNSYDEDDPVVGCLYDDLNDICHDLRTGIENYELGQIDNAVWCWRFSFEMHWGNHLVNALKALHDLKKTE